MLTREQAFLEIQSRIPNVNLQKHMIAAEAIMRELARHFSEDPDRWGLSGLLHDIDYNETAKDPQRHSLLGYEILKQLGVDEDIAYAVKVHNEVHGLPRLSLMDKALYAADPTTGLIVAAALILPQKKLHLVTTDFLMKRFHEKGFARGADRTVIASCSELGLSLEEFFTLSLQGMMKFQSELGL